MGEEYTEEGYKPDQYDKLQMLIGLNTKETPVYVLAIPKEDLPLEALGKLRENSKIPCPIQVNGTIDFVVSGSEEQVKEIARGIYETTGQNVGCVKYDGENMLNFYITLKEAIDIARAKGEPWHFFKHDEDSLQAMIEKARNN